MAANVLLRWVVVLCLTIASPWVAVAANLVPNPGFEEGRGGRVFAWTPNARIRGLSAEIAQARWVDGEGRERGRALKLTVREAQRFTIDWRSDLIPIEGGAQLHVSGWLRLQDVVCGSATWHKAGFAVVYFDRAKRRLRHSDVARLEGTTDWVLRSAKLKAPDEAAFALVSLGLSLCTGTVWFDDVGMRVSEPKSAIAPRLFAIPGAAPPEEPVLIPQPWQAEFGERHLVLGSPVSVRCERPEAHRHTIREMKAWLDGVGISTGGSEAAGSVIALGDPAGTSSWLKQFGVRTDFTELGDEGYVLAVRGDDARTTVVLASRGAAGIYYALQTLRQWAERRGERVVLREGVVHDRPAYRWRGLVSGTYSIPRLDLVKSQKRNLVLMTTLEGGNLWDKPLSDTMRKTLRQYRQETKRRFITVVPGVHPGKGTTKHHFSDASQMAAILDTYRGYHAAGFRWFSLRYDDMAMLGGQDQLVFEDDRKRFGTIGAAHAFVMGEAASFLKKLDPTTRLFVVPMHYWFDGSAAEAHYLKQLKHLSPEVELINCGATTQAKVRRHIELTSRRPWIWDNYFARYERGPTVPDVVGPLALSVDAQLPDEALGYMFPMLDKDMMWYMASDYLWRGADFRPQESARRALAKAFGRAAFAAVQRYANCVEETRWIPVSGATSAERISSLAGTVSRLRRHLADLEPLLPSATYSSLDAEVSARCAFIEEALIPQEREKPFPLRVPRCVSPPEVDGRLGDGAWQAAALLSDFVRPYHSGPKVVSASVQTEARLTHDGAHLYISVRCSEPEMSRIKTLRTERDKQVHLDDSVTLYLQPRSHTGPHYRLSVNPLGTVYDARTHDVRWNGDFRIATSKTAEAWLVEIAVAAKSLRAAPIVPGARWRLSIGRSRMAGVQEHSNWVVMKRGLHEIERFWAMEFVDRR